MAAVVTERNCAAGRIVTLTGSEQDVADSLGAGTGISAAKYYWNPFNTVMLWDSGIVGAISVAYWVPSG